MSHPQAARLRRAAEDAAGAARRLAVLDGAARNALLATIARELEAHAAAILAANAEDVAAARAAGLAEAMVDRLRLDPARLAGIVRAVREVAALPDPLGAIEWQARV